MKRAALFVWLVVVCGIAEALRLSPQSLQPHPRGYVSYHAASPLAIDGRLDDDAWRMAPWSDTFVDIEGDKKPRPGLDTRVKMLWDDTYFYIGADLAEPQLWATLTDHDSVIFHDNDFEVFIDPNGDNHDYGEFEINALGTAGTCCCRNPYKDDGKAVNGWEIAGLKSAIHLDGTLNDPRDTDRGWSVELALPWKALGELARRPSPPLDGDQWRVNFSRVQWPLQVPREANSSIGAPAPAELYRKRPGTKEDNWVWSPQHVIDMHRPERWGYVQFSTATTGAVSFVTDPAHTAREWLHRVYYAQRDYRKANARWAASLAELGLAAPSNPALTRPTLVVAGSQFEASIDLRRPGLDAELWHIRQDSLVWR